MTIRTPLQRSGLLAALAAAALLLLPATAMAKKKGNSFPKPPPISAGAPGFGGGYGHANGGPGYVNTGPRQQQGWQGQSARAHARQIAKVRAAQARQFKRAATLRLQMAKQRIFRAYRTGLISRHQYLRLVRQQRILKANLRRATRDNWVTFGEQASINAQLGGLGGGLQVVMAF
jgi:hypothetical protein